MFELDPGEQHRTCSQCGADCPPEPFETSDELRIAFVCPEHGVHAVIDPFEGDR
jgi:hypothetical protein